MVSVNVMLGASGAAGFTFGLVRTRMAEHRDRHGGVDNDLPDEAPPVAAGHGAEAGEVGSD